MFQVLLLPELVQILLKVWVWTDSLVNPNESGLKRRRFQHSTWEVDGLVSQEEAPGDAPAVPGPGEGQDLAQSPHVVFERSRADVAHS